MIFRHPLIACLSLLFLFSPALDAAAQNIHAARLRCEYLTAPLGIDQTEPRLGWIIESGERDARQTAYHLQVASSPEKLAADEADLWDSGKVEGDQTLHIAYAGKPLKSRQRCYWRVKVWDGDGQPSEWTKPAHWTMGLLEASDWTARFITQQDDSEIHKDPASLHLPPARQYRKEFSADKPIKRATLYATALGIYEAHLNGQRISDYYFAPGWTDYRQRAYYHTYDVTDQVQQGANAFGATVADGWYSGYVGFGLLTGIGTEQIGRYTYGKTPAMMAQLEIEYEDGTEQVVGTDASWRVTNEGPFREADLLMGERYDARKEFAGWTKPGFDDSDWERAMLAAAMQPVPATFYEYRNPPLPGQPPEKKGQRIDLAFKRPRLEAFPGVPVRVTEEFTPQRILPAGGENEKHAAIFDLGQNFAGVVRLKVKGPAGHKVKLRFGEMLHPDGRLMTENLRKARAVDTYILRGDPEGEVYTPRFTFHGFQYVEVSNLPGEPTEETITGLALHSDTPLVSEFECSDPMVNQLFSNIVWTQRANFLDLPTDCPQRDERMGWTGDAQIYVAAAAYNADVAAFFTKWLRELMESQRPSGAFPGYAPYPFQHGWDFGTAWADAGIICPWTIWQAYGDTKIINTCWPEMTKFMQWRKGAMQDGLGVNHGNSWGDWLNINEPTPLRYVDTVYLAQSSRMMAEMAKATGRYDEATEYDALFQQVRDAFNAKYMNDDGSLKVQSQTAYALALTAGLPPDELREATGRHLAERVKNNRMRMATGFLGTRSLLPALSSTGHDNLAAFLLQSHEYPSWGYEIDQGATSIWERWNSYTKQDGFGNHNAAMNSFAHYSFGAVCEWMFGTLAGIRADGPGYKRIIIAPNPPAPGSNADHEPIDWVRTSYDSIRGKITSNWRLSNDNDRARLEMEIEIPANTTATVHVPALAGSNITINGMPIEESKDARMIERTDQTASLEVGSGEYTIESSDAARKADTALSTNP